MGLCVEGNADNLRLIERMFTRSLPDVELITAMEGKRGLELARQRQPDLIVLDFKLPDISGEQVLRGLQHEVGTQQIRSWRLSAKQAPARVERAGALSCPCAAFLALATSAGEPSTD